RMTLYAVDAEKKEIYSRFLALNTVKDIRLPINERSIAGYVATTGKVVSIADAYDKGELAKISPTLSFDGSWDKKTGFRTQQILAMPITHEGRTTGVIQLLNKRKATDSRRRKRPGGAGSRRPSALPFTNNSSRVRADRRRRSTNY